MGAEATDRAAAWKVALVLAPLAALGLIALDGRGAALPDPVRDRPMEEVEANLSKAEARAEAEGDQARREGRELVVFLGDSRYRAAVSKLGRRDERETVQTLRVGERSVEVFGLVGRGVSSFREFEDVFDRVFALRPSAIVIQPEMLVPHANYHDVKAGPVAAGAGQRGHLANVVKQWAQTPMPAENRELELLDRLITRTRAAGVSVLVAEVPPSVTVLDRAPAGYFHARRRLIAAHLAEGERDYLRKQEVYADALFRDYRHLTREGSEDWFPWALEATLRRLERAR